MFATRSRSRRTERQASDRIKNRLALSALDDFCDRASAQLYGVAFAGFCSFQDARINLMNAVIVLFALSAVTGFALRSLSWLALGACGVMLAVLSSAALHVQGFSALPGIAIVAACLTVNQIAYVAGLLASQSRPKQPTKADANHLGLLDALA